MNKLICSLAHFVPTKVPIDIKNHARLKCFFISSLPQNIGQGDQLHGSRTYTGVMRICRPL